MRAPGHFAAVMSAGLSACCFSPVGPPEAGHDAGGDGGSVCCSPAPDAGPPTQCVIGGATYGAGVLSPENYCESCQPAVDPSGWTNLPDGTSCPAHGAGAVCFSGVCQPGCFIDGSFYGEDQRNPQNSCQACNSRMSTSTWSDLPVGTACAASQLCDSKGACVATCSIGGVVYPRGAAKPQDPSLCCSPSRNGADWSFRLQDGGTYQADQQQVTSIAVKDFNGDGQNDLAVVSGLNSTTTRVASVTVWLGQVDGGFGGASVYNACNHCWGLAAGDLNGDGFPDLIVPERTPLTDYTSGRMVVFINRGDGTGRFGPGVERQFSPFAGAEFFPLVDLDGDGILDLALAGPAAYFLKGLGDGGFADPVGYSLVTSFWASGIVAGDFRGLGILDLVTANGPGSVTMVKGDGKGKFSSYDIDVSPLEVRGLAVGDFNGDGLVDLGLAGEVGAELLPGEGNGSFGSAVRDMGPEGSCMSFADLDDNGRSDLIVAPSATTATALAVFWSNSDNTITQSSVPTASAALSILAADLNGDGSLDIVAGGESGSVNVFVNGCP